MGNLQRTAKPVSWLRLSLEVATMANATLLFRVDLRDFHEREIQLASPQHSASSTS